MQDNNKTVSLEVIDGFLVIKVDPNKDGQAVMEVKLNILEVPDEIMQLMSKK